MTSPVEAGRRLGEKRAFFDSLAPDWHRDNPLTPRSRDLLLAALPSEILEFPAPAIDLGGGTGRLAEFLREKIPSPLLVFDLSRRMLKELRTGSVHGVQGDAHHLPLRAVSYTHLTLPTN